MHTHNPQDYNILIVDDLPKNIQVLGNVLNSQNYNVEFATSGKNALEFLIRQCFDLILLDIMMPEMNGYDTCQKIRELESCKDTPIIFLTAKTDKESLVKGFEMGGQDYITKPFDVNELLARVKTQLELKSSKYELRQLNSRLEAKVKERTIELEHANKKLHSVNNELLELDREKAEFLKIISHEIRTPLNGLMGMLNLIKEDIRDKDVLQYFDYIDISSYRLEKFAIQALLITELRTNKKILNIKEINIAAEIQNILNEFKTSIGEKQLNAFFKQSNEEIFCKVDVHLLIKCIENVIENAIHYCTRKGSVEIQIKKSEKYTIIEISDNGSGFSEMALSNLFKLFSSGGEHIDKNIGLDLAIVNLIMKAHHGTAEAYNNKSGGASVKLSFPN